MGFTPDRTGFYFTDTRHRTIYRFDYDVETGALSNQRCFVRTPDAQGGPDGMTVDAGGHVWTAKWDGGCVVHYDTAAVEIERIVFPARKVSCATFGGDGYRDLYVTTAGGDHKPEEGSGAGALFRVRDAGQGVPEFRSRLAG
jgi:D-xylonolactonase